jgi:bleomycin hydrolase
MQTIQKEKAHHTSGNDIDGALSPALLDSLRTNFKMGPGDLACQNAVINNSVKKLVLNRGQASTDDGHFSHRIQTKGITDQKMSGRCWIFAGLNVLRPQIMREHCIMDFTFSSSYLQFWDKMEKANLYLESVIELRDTDYLDREWELVQKHTMQDGGWWNYLVGLVQKYGVVPQSAMPETHASSHTDTLNEVLGRLLRSRAVRLLEHSSAGVGLDGPRCEKDKILAEVYRLLVLHFGEPPSEFDWRYVTNEHAGMKTEHVNEMKSPENKSLSKVERHTPHSFSEKYLGGRLSDFVCLYNDPLNPMNRHYRFDRARNIIGNECMNFINVDTFVMKNVAIASILANEALWFAVNMGIDQSAEHGMMKHRLFDYETLFGIDLTLTKAERTRLHVGASNHAMALMGVDLDSEGKPRKWLVENSWGDHKGNKGTWTLHDDWFDEQVYTIVVHRRHVPSDILDLFSEEATLLPAWYPGAFGTENVFPSA